MEDRPRGRGRGRGHSAVTQNAAAAAQQQPQQQQASSSSSSSYINNNSSGVTSQAVATLSQAVSTMSVTPAGAAPARGGTVGVNRRPPRVSYMEQRIMDNLPAANLRCGTKGKPLVVKTNFIAFKEVAKDITPILYDMNLTDNIKAVTVVSKYNFLKDLQNRGQLPKCGIAYDGRMLFTSEMLNPQEMFSLDIADSQYVVGTSGRVSFKKVAECAPGTDGWYRVMNVIYNLDQQLLGQKKYGNDFFVPPSNDVAKAKYNDANDCGFIPGRYKLKDQFELLQGYSLSFQRAFHNNTAIPIMHVGGTHRLATIQTAMAEIKRNPRSVNGLPGRTVLTRYNNKTYSVIDATNPISIDSTFDTKQGKKSYRQYFLERYGVQLTQSQQPFLRLKLKRVDRVKEMMRRRKKGEPKPETENEISIPAELCYLTGFSEEEKARFQRDKDFNDLCRKAPEKRSEDPERFIKFVESSEVSRDLLASWKIQMIHQPVQVKARVLDICFDKRQQFRQTASLNNNAVNVIKPPSRQDTNVVVGVFAQCRTLRGDGIQAYVDNLKQAAQKMSYQLSPINLPGNTINEAIMNGLQKKVDIVLLIIDDTFRYKEIKTTSVEQGILTQVVRGVTAGKAMTAQKVAMQIACKVGFIPWRLPGGLLSSGNHDFMIVGVDVFSGKGASAVQAAVFSLDRDCGNYYTFVNYAQGRNQECVFKFEQAFSEALGVYRKRNGKLPSRIFVYRDGVSDGQLMGVRESETKPIMEQLTKIYGSQPFHFVVTVVKKRISQRFFQVVNNRSQNVPPGTVVDQLIVRPNWFEYFMVPQDAGQGTATPTNYNVIENNHNSPGNALYLSPDELQHATFALTHLYFNWTGTIRVPAPVQYAHKCAFLLGQCAINSTVHQNIRQNLFYL